jgi:hypothetical protein
MRPKGKIISDSSLERNPTVEAAQQHQKQLQQQREKRAAADRQRRYDNAPNWICYPEVFNGRVDENGNWLGGKVPRCIKCKGLLHPNEHHVCPGYMPDLTRLNTNLTPEQRKEIRRAAWLEGDGDWDDDQYDPTTPQEGGFDKMLHEAETGETYDQVVLESWDEDRWMAWRRQQLGHDENYDPSLDIQDEQLDWDHEEYEDYEE